MKRNRSKRYAHYLIRPRYDGSWEWILIQSVRTLAASSDTFATKQKALANAKLVRKYAGDAEITEAASVNR
jgi:hypothetical protein